MTLHTEKEEVLSACLKVLDSKKWTVCNSPIINWFDALDMIFVALKQFSQPDAFKLLRCSKFSKFPMVISLL